jgi:DNA-binding PadR family transcriptional regulator
MSDTSLSERLQTLDAQPEAIVDLWRAVYDALATDGSDAEALRVAKGLSVEATRFTLTWMGHGRTDVLDRLTASLQEALASRDVMAPLTDVPSPNRLAARFYDLARVIGIYQRTNNAARHVGALAGERRRIWREVLRWAYPRREGFSVSDLTGAGFYSANRTSAYSALNRLVEEGLLFKNEVRDSATFTLSWDGRSACQALWGIEELGGAPPEHVEGGAAKTLKTLRASLVNERREKALMRQQLAAMSQELTLLRKEKADPAPDGIPKTFGYDTGIKRMCVNPAAFYTQQSGGSSVPLELLGLFPDDQSVPPEGIIRTNYPEFKFLSGLSYASALSTLVKRSQESPAYNHGQKRGAEMRQGNADMPGRSRQRG